MTTCSPGPRPLGGTEVKPLHLQREHKDEADEGDDVQLDREEALRRDQHVQEVGVVELLQQAVEAAQRKLHHQRQVSHRRLGGPQLRALRPKN